MRAELGRTGDSIARGAPYNGTMSVPDSVEGVDDRPSGRIGLALATDRPTVGGLVDAVEEGGMAIACLLFAAPLVVPLPPFASASLGAALAVLGAQWLAGRERPMLPARLRAVPLPATLCRLLRVRGVAWLRGLEDRMRRRPPRTDTVLARTLSGAAVLACGIVMALPIPFMNTPPAFAVALVALGMSGGDGRWWFAGIALALAMLVGLSIAAVLAGDAGARWLRPG